MTWFKPADEAQVAEAVAWAAAGDQPLEIVGGGSKRGLGRPSSSSHVLDLSALSGIVDYEPSELVMTARAATPMATIEAALATHNQMLAFEPPDWRALLASQGTPTLGGVIACNLAGPRRVRAGAARDHFLGFVAVDGRGEQWKAGGKVVKNVTGYDMGKLQAGAYGTLSVLTELTVKVLPKAETQATVLIFGQSDEAAVRALALALNSPHEVSAAAHLPAAVAARSGVEGAHGAMTAVRIEGPRPSVDYRAGVLEDLLGGTTRLDERESVRFWSNVSAVQPLLSDPDAIVWRICPTPSAAPVVVAQIRASLASAEWFYDWGGGLLWLSLDAGEAGSDCGAAIVRGAVAASGGHAMLFRASAEARGRVPVFGTAEGALGALTRRVKNSFDPKGVLNPGRMQEGV